MLTEAALPLDTFCPATMCPLFARDGSRWTGDIDAHCDGPACGWFAGGGCQGAVHALEGVDDERRSIPLPLRKPPKSYECPRADECQWQRESAPSLCPPRAALSHGVSPTACLG